MRKLDTATIALVIVGALNWGLVGAAEFDLVATIAGLEFGEVNGFTRVIYGLVAAAGLWLAGRAFELVGGRDRAMARAM